MCVNNNFKPLNSWGKQSLYKYQYTLIGKDKLKEDLPLLSLFQTPAESSLILVSVPLSSCPVNLYAEKRIWVKL